MLIKIPSDKRFRFASAGLMRCTKHSRMSPENINVKDKGNKIVKYNNPANLPTDYHN
jgi:hypothetical protein